ncbi:aldose epimerase family protein [Sunxiuqinia sp. sy24]|uniref:aldose epimerase family protein n=1 Tax=Sunxiuqinia sp. sy24 TaxID=3461495 RepID=UPI00404539DA
MKKLVFLFLIAGVACQQPAQKKEEPLYSKANFESTIDGKQTTLYSLKNANGMKVTLTNYGAKIVSILVPDREGNLADVALGFKSIAEYQTQDAGQGAVVGPFANRIANAQFELNGEVYQLEVNNHKANLHSGTQSFYRQVYDAKELKTADGPAVAMTLNSPDGASGFPGNKEVTVTYTLTDKNELKIDYQATTDKACPFNLTNHVYFNLKGEGNGNILDHIIVIDADSTTEVLNNELIPTGKIVSIKSTDMDFSSPHIIGERIDSEMPALAVAGGYDHNYILNKDQESDELTFCASVYEPKSGRYMEVFTTEPAVQFYTGNFLNGTLTGRSGKTYKRRYGLCLETQHYPDSPNHSNFPNTILEPGDTLNSTTIYKFAVKED